MISERAEGLVMFSDPLIVLHKRRIAELAARRRLPAVYASREAVDAGGVMSYGPSGIDLFRRAAYFVDKILKGTKPAELPGEQTTKVEFVNHLQAGEALALTIPPSLLVRADHVIR